MSSGSRKRSERVAALNLPPGKFARIWAECKRSETLIRLALCLFAAFLMWAMTGGWQPPFSFRRGQVPSRDVVARVGFERPDDERTKAMQEIRLRETHCIYANDPRPIQELRTALQSDLRLVVSAESYAQLDRMVWRRFLADDTNGQEATFDMLKAAFPDADAIAQLEKALPVAFADIEANGILDKLQHDINKGSQTQIVVRDKADSERVVVVEKLSSIAVLGHLKGTLRKSLEQISIESNQLDLITDMMHQWLSNQKLPQTLVLNAEATNANFEKARADVEEAVYVYESGDTLVPAGQALKGEHLQLLLLEHERMVAEFSISRSVIYGAAKFSMYLGLFAVCGFYVSIRRPEILRKLRQFVGMLGLMAMTVVAAWFVSRDGWWAELVPVALFAMTVAIAYDRHLAIFLTAAVALVVTLMLGLGLAELVVLGLPASAAVPMIRTIRSRTKLIYVGLFAAVVAFLANLFVGLLTGPTFGSPLVATATTASSLVFAEMQRSLLQAFYALLASFLMTGLLPFIERVFGVQTDLRLLELGDAAHPLLGELSRRAPGTYNHSITVASLAEAAAEAIGARGLLVRVGAYFHDIGKMLEPGYFIENQSGANRHESLVPAMSTLVIIAHVKDGADLARQHHLPPAIIDFIEQHHGTTLVEFFYRRAQETEEHETEVDENNYRYPGPKPQTPEAGVMMLADSVESASRTLVDPAPARIDSLVHEISMSRLMDGQFDECGLTLKELRIVENSLIKSLTALYHGRVKYPEKQKPRIASETFG